MVPKVARTIMSPKTQPKKTAGKASSGMLPNNAMAPTPKVPETKLATITPIGSYVNHVLRSSIIA